VKGASRPLPFFSANGGRGFTLIELLITMAVMTIVISISLPMYTRYVARSRQEDARVQLTAIRQAQEMYKLQHGAYTNQTALLSGWKTTSGRYAFSITGFGAAVFTAQATGNIDSDTTQDMWTMDQDGNLVNTMDDVKN
jgi:prepilin-type N-terminal cleavage/methylation domain-containing protein